MEEQKKHLLSQLVSVGSECESRATCLVVLCYVLT